MLCVFTVICIQELAEQEGDLEKVGELASKLEEIEERAVELDKQRSKGLSAIRCVCTLYVLHFHSIKHTPTLSTPLLPATSMRETDKEMS